MRKCKNQNFKWRQRGNFQILKFEKWGQILNLRKIGVILKFLRSWEAKLGTFFKNWSKPKFKSHQSPLFSLFHLLSPAHAMWPSPPFFSLLEPPPFSPFCLTLAPTKPAPPTGDLLHTPDDGDEKTPKPRRPTQRCGGVCRGAWQTKLSQCFNVGNWPF